MPTNTINPVKLDEPLTRYIFQKSHCGGGRVKHGAFMPNSKNGEVSIYRIEGWESANIWDEGKEIGGKSGKSLKGRGDFQWEKLEGAAVVGIYPDPHPSRHANIKDFPEPREKAQEQATILAEACQFVRFSPQ